MAVVRGVEVHQARVSPRGRGRPQPVADPRAGVPADVAVGGEDGDGGRRGQQAPLADHGEADDDLAVARAERADHTIRRGAAGWGGAAGIRMRDKQLPVEQRTTGP